MAKKDRAGLTAVISTNLADNAVEAITPLKHREVEDDLKDSNFNLEDDAAEDVTYNPSPPENWGLNVPNNVAEGLDFLALDTFVPPLTVKGNKTGSNAKWQNLTASDLKTILQYLAEQVGYTPTTNANWDATIPTELQASTDQLASRLRTLENAPATIYTIQLYAHTDSTVSNIFPIFGKANLIGTTENKSSKVSSVSYETSANGGDTWVAHANYTTLKANLTTITMPGNTFVFVRAIFTFLGGFVGEQAITLNYNNF